MSDKQVANYSKEELRKLAQTKSEEFEPGTENVKEQFAQHEDEVNGFIYTRQITAGDQQIPRELIYLDYVKDKKKPLSPYDFFKILKLKFKSRKVTRMGYRTDNYYINWPGVTVNNEIFLAAYKEMRPYRRPHHGKANYKNTRKQKEARSEENSEKETV